MLPRKVLTIPEKELTTLPMELTLPEKGEPLLKKGVSFRVSGKFGVVAGIGYKVADKSKVVASNLYDDYSGFKKKSGVWFCGTDTEKTNSKYHRKNFQGSLCESI